MSLFLTLILLTWIIWWAPDNASKWQMGFNSAFRGLICLCFFSNTVGCVELRSLLCSVGKHRFAELIQEEAEILTVRVERGVFQIAPVLTVVDHFVSFREKLKVNIMFCWPRAKLVLFYKKLNFFFRYLWGLRSVVLCLFVCISVYWMAQQSNEIYRRSTFPC